METERSRIPEHFPFREQNLKSLKDYNLGKGEDVMEMSPPRQEGD
jgi:hypothetical protein